MNKYCTIWPLDLRNKISWNYAKFIVITEKHRKKIVWTIKLKVYISSLNKRANVYQESAWFGTGIGASRYT